MIPFISYQSTTGHVTMHTVRFNWFLSGLEWILNLDFCLDFFLIFYKKLLRNVRYRLSYSSFWVFGLYSDMFHQSFEAFCTKNIDFHQTYLNTGSKTQNVEELSLDMIFHNNFLLNIKSCIKQKSKLIIPSKPDRNWSKLTVFNIHRTRCKTSESL